MLSNLATIRDGDGWYRAWSALGAATEINYHRASKVFLPVADPRRPIAYRRAVAAFRWGLDELGFEHRVLTVAFGRAAMRGYPSPVTPAGPSC